MRRVSYAIVSSTCAPEANHKGGRKIRMIIDRGMMGKMEYPSTETCSAYVDLKETRATR